MIGDYYEFLGRKVGELIASTIMGHKVHPLPCYFFWGGGITHIYYKFCRSIHYIIFPYLGIMPLKY